MDHPPLEQLSFEPEQQAEILRLAARLQEAHSGRMSLAQLESLAEEAGIRAEFVRQAALCVSEQGGKKKRRRRKDEIELSIALAVIGVVVLQVFAAFNFIFPSFYTPLPFWLAIVLPFLLGLALSGRKSGLGRALGILLGSTAFIALGVWMLVGSTTGRETGNWWPALGYFVAVESLSLFIGCEWRFLRDCWKVFTSRNDKALSDL